MRSEKDPRHIARVKAVMDLYHTFFENEEIKDILQGNQDEELDLGNYSKKVHENILNGVKEKYKEIDTLINTHSHPVKSTDLDNLLLQIIRVAVFEGFISKSVPPKVAVDEAIELTRDFGLEMASRKVSGILGKIFENLVKKEPSKDLSG